MFQSYKYKKPLINEDDTHCWEYEITDSEFGTVSGIETGVDAIWPFMIGAAVIGEYSKRNLNAAANLAICFVWISKKYLDWSIQEMIDYNKEYNPLFPPYEKDLQKYMVLL
jgi:hypothetical protein